MSILAVHVFSTLTGAPAAPATAIRCWVTKAETLDACPDMAGQMPLSQRASLPVVCVGVAKASMKLSIAWRDGGAVGAGWASARLGASASANTINRSIPH